MKNICFLWRIFVVHPGDNRAISRREEFADPGPDQVSGSLKMSACLNWWRLSGMSSNPGSDKVGFGKALPVESKLFLVHALVHSRSDSCIVFLHALYRTAATVCIEVCCSLILGVKRFDHITHPYFDGFTLASIFSAHTNLIWLSLITSHGFAPISYSFIAWKTLTYLPRNITQNS